MRKFKSYDVIACSYAITIGVKMEKNDSIEPMLRNPKNIKF